MPDNEGMNDKFGKAGPEDRAEASGDAANGGAANGAAENCDAMHAGAENGDVGIG